MKMYFVGKIGINRAALYKHKLLNDLLLSFDNKIIVGNLIDFAKYLQRKIKRKRYNLDFGYIS